MDITPDMQSLLEKLDALELTEGERTAFGQLFAFEDDEEVEGFTYQKITWTVQGFSFGVEGPRRGKVVDHKAHDQRVVDHRLHD